MSRWAFRGGKIDRYEFKKENDVKLQLIADTPPTRGKFIAIYNDGSGARLFQFDDEGGLFDSDGVQCDAETLDDHLHWIQLPDDFHFWCSG